jgi:AcrR family transcriptional regulator
MLAAFREFHRNGFISANIDSILAEAGVSKGALYHHFQSKIGLGYAVVDEVLRDWILDRWQRPIVAAQDPIKALIELLDWAARHSTVESLALGCPLNTLSQELSGRDSGFRSRLARIYSDWRSGIELAFERAQRRALIRSDADCAASAALVVAAWEGTIGLSKTDLSPDTVDACRRGLESFLQSLRPQDSAPD